MVRGGRDCGGGRESGRRPNAILAVCRVGAFPADGLTAWNDRIARDEEEVAQLLERAAAEVLPSRGTRAA